MCFHESSLFLSPEFDLQLEKKRENLLDIQVSILDVTNDSVFIDDNSPTAEPFRGTIREERLGVGKGSVLHSHPGTNVRNNGKIEIQTLGKIRVCDGIIHAGTQDLGVEALIEIEFSIVRLHLPRSDGGKGCREKRDDQVVFPEIVLAVMDQSVLGRGKDEPRSLNSHLQGRIRRPCAVGPRNSGSEQQR
jgi:hypothetical protein